MNTLVDTISLRIDLGYQFTGSQRRVNILQYADDTCLVASSPAACQCLLSTVAKWLEWSAMSVKIPKCQCIGLQESTGKLVDPQLHLNDQAIPFTPEPVRFLGLKVQVPSHNTSSRPTIISRPDTMLTAVDATPLTRRQKMLMFSAGICPRLSWPLMTQELPTSWVENSRATRHLKRWSGLSKLANISILHLSRSQPSKAIHSPQRVAGVTSHAAPNF